MALCTPNLNHYAHHCRQTTVFNVEQHTLNPRPITDDRMKEFKMFAGAYGELGVYEMTNNEVYRKAFEVVTQLRDRMLKDPVLREPLLRIYQGVYDEDAKLRSRTPHRPTDDTVMEFLSEAFPHLYLVDFPPSSKKVVWGETMSGPSHATSERVSINEELTNVWLVKASTPAVSRIALAFLFLAIFLHELGHSALVWYGGGQRTTPKSDGVDREAGVYMETRYFGGIVVGAFDTKTKVIKDVGLSKGKDFYSVDNQRAAELLKLDTKNGLPFLDVSGESPDPKAPGTSTSKFWPVKTPSRLLSSTRLSNIRPFLVDDKKVVP